jgi:hypothetical protein
MQKNTTDYIAKLSWDALRDHWKAFILIPLAPLVIVVAAGLLTTLGFSMFGFGESLQELIALIQLVYFATLLFYLVYSTAAAQWCATLFSGKKELDIKGGLRYGLSRLGGVLGTSILTGLKCMLWFMLLILPGLYKGLTYSQSIHISQLEKISGGDANRLSKVLIREAGILRTLGNYMALIALFYLGFTAFYLAAFAVMVPFGLATAQNGTPEEAGFGIALLFIGILAFAFYAGMMAFMMCFGNFQYLCFRDENKIAFQKAIKDLKAING